VRFCAPDHLLRAEGQDRPGELATEQRRDILVSYRSGDMVAPALAEREALRSMVDEFERAIRTGTPALTDGRSGLRVLEILQAASESLANGGVAVRLRGEDA